MRRYTSYIGFGTVVIAVVLMVYIFYQIEQVQSRTASSLLKASVSHTESELNGFFHPVESLMYAVRDHRKFGLFDAPDEKQLSMLLYPLIINHSQISSIGVADSSGYEFNVIPGARPGFWSTRTVDIPRWDYSEKWASWEQNPVPVKSYEWENELVSDPRSRPWFKGVYKVPKGNISWTLPYQYVTGPDVGMTASVLINSDSEIDRILAFDLTLKDLDNFIDHLTLTPNQNLYLVTIEDSTMIGLRHTGAENEKYIYQGIAFGAIPKDKFPYLHEMFFDRKNGEPFSFTFEGKKWWGISHGYMLSGGREIRILTSLPEGDFLIGLNTTKFILLISFLSIVVLSIFILRSDRNIQNLAEDISEKNRLINKQNEYLFSEVHHRVKNNLALISAFNELEALEEKDGTQINGIKKIQNRIKVIAIVQEEGYQSDKSGWVPTEKYISKIVHWRQIYRTVDLYIESRLVNANQALTHGLMINELIECCINSARSERRGVGISITTRDGRLKTTFNVPSEYWDEMVDKVNSHKILEALVLQLEGTSILDKKSLSYSIEFELRNKKGIMSNWT